MIDEPVKVRHGRSYGDDDSEVLSHPSYGQISISRITGNIGQMFGTEINQSSMITIKISSAELNQSLGRSWYHDVESIVEVSLSPIQYAEMISSPNTQGVPCTINFIKGVGNIKYRPHSTQVEHAQAKVDDSIDKLQNKLKPWKDRAQQILSKKGAMKAADKKELSFLFDQIDREMRDSIPFYSEQVRVNAERMVTEAKVDVESIVTHVQNKLGQFILDNPDTLGLLLENKD